MFRLAVSALFVSSLLLTSLSAQIFDKGDKKLDPMDGPGKTVTPGKTSGKPLQQDAIPGECEIMFLNGSKVRLIIQTEKIDIATIYGNLSVPIQDVLAIEFGLHFPDGHVAKIDAAIKGLSSSDFRARENAAKNLLELGPYSYAALVQAGRLKDPEAAGRAKELMQKMQAKYPKKDLRTNPDDKIVTPTQTIVGRIVTPSVKTKAEYFGEVDHKLANMRNLRAVGGASLDFEVVLDAGKYCQQGQWLETTFQCDGRSSIVVTARGQVDLMPNQGGQFAGPNGILGGGRFGPGGMMAMKGQRINGPINPQVHCGWLIGKVGEEGEPFLIGDRYEGNPEREGYLYLHIGSSPWGPAVGSYDIKVSRKND